MPNSNSRHPIGTQVFVFIFFLISISCGTFGSFNQSQKELDLKIKAFNFEFEGKNLERSARFVHPDYRGEYLEKSLELANRTTILEAVTLDLQFFMDNKVIPLSAGSEDFNKAEVTIRYQISILPSTKLKTILVKQEWHKVSETWFVIPKINSFLN